MSYISGQFSEQTNDLTIHIPQQWRAGMSGTSLFILKTELKMEPDQTIKVPKSCKTKWRAITEPPRNLKNVISSENGRQVALMWIFINLVLQTWPIMRGLHGISFFSNFQTDCDDAVQLTKNVNVAYFYLFSVLFVTFLYSYFLYFVYNISSGN